MTTSQRVELEGGGFSCVRIEGPERAPAIAIVPPLGLPSEAFEPFLVRLATRLHVVAVELPGSGGASGARVGWTTRDLGRALVTSLAHAGIRRAHLFGISLGGMIAQWAAIEHGERFERLVLASTAPRGMEIALSSPGAKLALARRLVSRDLAKSLARGVVSSHVRHDPEAMERIEGAIEDHPHDAEDLLWLVTAAARHDAREELASIALPTLVLTGRNDELVPAALQDELEVAIRGATRGWIEDAGHDVTLDQPERTADAVLAFVDPR